MWTVHGKIQLRERKALKICAHLDLNSQTHLFIVEVIEGSRPLGALRVADQREEGELLSSLPGRQDHHLVHELDRRPHGDRGEGVEDLLFEVNSSSLDEFVSDSKIEWTSSQIG